MLCSICQTKLSLWIKDGESIYCTDCAKALIGNRSEDKVDNEESFEILLANVPEETRKLLSTFDDEILADLSADDWTSTLIVEDCMDIVLEKVFPTLCLDDVEYQVEANAITVTLPAYWQRKARESEEIMDYVTCPIHWKRR